MKIKYFILFFAILTLSACAQSARAEQLATTSAPADPVVAAVVTQAEAINKAVVTQAEAANKADVIQAEATNKIEARCVRNSEETQLLVNNVLGYCLQYPVGYDIVFQNEMEIMVVKGSILNSEHPSLIIDVEPADGKTVEQVADQLAADYSVPGLEVKRVPLVIDQEQAIMLDGLTGEDVNRQVVVLHNDLVYHMTIAPMEYSYSPDVHAQAEALFNTVIQSFTFHPETSFYSDCPAASE